jgi:hypothetical protein
MADNIKLDLKETGRLGVAWIGLAQDWDKKRCVLKTEFNIWGFTKCGKFLTS